MTNTNRTWTIAVVTLIAGGVLGYGLARISERSAPATEAKPAPAASSGVLKLPDTFLQTMDIALEAVAPGDLSAEILAPATVTAAPNGQAVVTARAAGTVVRLE